jgi:myo-inositol-1(or 4)-monophosphatase
LPPDPRYLATAVEAALVAGRIHRTYFRHRPAIEKKGRIDLVTAADREAEQACRDLVARRFPTHGVLGEEGGAPAPAAECRWIIDPVDGTTNFAHGLALFCVSIALEIAGRVDVAAVFDPMAEELFTAERGQGSRLNGQRLRVTPVGVLVDGMLCTGFPYAADGDRSREVAIFAAFLSEARAVRRLGSAALDLCYVAAGRLDGFWEDHLHAWDIAAGALIVEEAGGRVTDYGGGPLDLGRGQILASNGPLHEPMRQVIAGASSATVRGGLDR